MKQNKLKIIFAFLILLVLLVGCIDSETTPSEEQSEEQESEDGGTLGDSDKAEVFKAIRNAVDEHLGK